MLDLIITALFILILIVWIQSRPFTWKGKGIKWMVPLPLFGNTSKVLVKSWADFWNEFYSSQKTNEVIGFHFFSSPALLVKDPALLKKIMVTDADHFMSREFEEFEEDPVGHSIFFKRGSAWKNQRTKLTPYFTPSRIKATMPIFHSVTDRLVRFIDEESKKGPLDASSTSLKMATDIIISIVFGLQPDSFDNPRSFFFQLQNELLSFGVGLRGMINIMMPVLYRVLRLTFFGKSTVEKISNFVTDVLLQRSKGIGTRPDFIQGMLDLWDKKELGDTPNVEAVTIGQGSKKGFDKKTIIGQCILMYTAGTETTGNTLGLVLYELAFNQNVQDTLRMEIKSMLERTNHEYGLDDIYSLKYMGQVINETLRKYSVSPVVGRKCTSPYNLNGLEIPVGTIIPIPLYAIHRDPNYFSDPMKFDPDRFSPDASITPGTYLPFGDGPRICIGMKFAEAEIRLALCKLLPKFKTIPCQRTPVPVTFSRNPTLNPSVPLWLDFKHLD